MVPPRRFLFVTIACLVVYGFAEGQIISESDTARLKKKILVPIVVYTPETQLGIGGLGVLLSHPERSKNDFTRTSNAELALLYTTKNQIIFLPKYTIFTKREKYYFEGLGELLLNFPEYYYGIGNRTPFKNQEQVAYQLVGWEGKWLRKVFANEKIFFGIETRYFKRYDVKIKPGGLLDSSKPVGYNGSTSVGIGPALTWDERDNVINPSKGFFIDVRNTYQGKFLGGTVSYTRFLIDTRKYFNVVPAHRQILALQFFGHFVQGEVPWKELPELGGPRIMRGYFRGRYRDKHLVSFQAEYRVPIYKWFGMVAFVGMGQVTDTNDYDWAHLKTCYGTGIRVMINKKENLNLRLDYGRGDRNKNGFFYFGFSESF